jgi:two-component system phosphate regulon sensor histidine kinase PhoR
MRLLTYAVMFYMSMALIWWTILLTKNNRELLHAKTEIISGKNPNDTKALEEVIRYHERKANMILGEGLVFGFMLIIGLYLIQRLFNKEMEGIKSQKNFLLSITHELKSPIASVNLITETLQKRELDKSTQNTLFSNILSESRRLEKLINNLLFSTKLQSAYAYNFEDSDVSAIINDFINKFLTLFPGIGILKKVDPGIMAKIDREAFESLISNLLENAVKYGGENEEIEVALKEFNGGITLTVKDKGPGIPKENRKKVFEQFYRQGNEETRKTKGTGLGLYIVKKIVEAHKGNIEILDNIPHGSIFSVFLPVLKN